MPGAFDGMFQKARGRPEDPRAEMEAAARREATRGQGGRLYGQAAGPPRELADLEEARSTAVANRERAQAALQEANEAGDVDRAEQLETALDDVEANITGYTEQIEALKKRPAKEADFRGVFLGKMTSGDVPARYATQSGFTTPPIRGYRPSDDKKKRRRAPRGLEGYDEEEDDGDAE